MMITIQERVTRQEIFQLIRLSIQELHADKIILEDMNGTPFLFKSKDAQVWARIFYRSMRDYSVEELQQEIKKLWVLMPNDAILYLFYPELDRQQIFKMNGFSDRLSFFEYGGLLSADREKVGARICKWIPSSMPALSLAQDGEMLSRVHLSPGSFLQSARLTSQEIAGLAELSLALHRV
ncbi:MAG: hypothetical protein ABH891_04100 [Candidatus Omnitrophota bacterium]